MAKKTNEKVDATKMSDEQLKKLHDKFRKDLREKFGKWLTVYDEEATKEDVDKAKAEFDEEVAKYANKTYVIAEKDALAFAELLKKWNSTLNHWEKGTWKGMLMFDKVICVFLKKKLQVLRLMEREGIDEDYALAKIHSQMDLYLKKEMADYVIDSSGTFDETKLLVLNVINDIKGVL